MAQVTIFFLEIVQLGMRDSVIMIAIVHQKDERSLNFRNNTSSVLIMPVVNLREGIEVRINFPIEPVFELGFCQCCSVEHKISSIFERKKKL